MLISSAVRFCSLANRAKRQEKLCFLLFMCWGDVMGGSEDRAANNRLFAAFPRAVANKISAQLEVITLQRGTILHEPRAPVEYAYFPDCGLVSLVKVMRDGRTVEVGAVGVDGMTCIDRLLGMEPSTFETVVQVQGYGRRLKLTTLQAQLEKSHELKALMLRYMSYRVNQLAQTAACNRLHTLRQRCCRWLLTAQDNVQAPTYAITHEFLALLMGVNRPSVSLAIGALQRRGLIHCRRGSITVVKRQALEEESCECYESLKRDCESMCRRR
jgi:CRP-like cAMP-binding protein